MIPDLATFHVAVSSPSRDAKFVRKQHHVKLRFDALT